MVGLRSFDLCCADVFGNPFPSWSGASVYIGTHFVARIRNLLRCSRVVQWNLVESDLRRALSGVFDLDGLFLSQWVIVTTPNEFAMKRHRLLFLARCGVLVFGGTSCYQYSL
jgi:hypothetical protein